jgi:WXG100 family type VII secretion target
MSEIKVDFHAISAASSDIDSSAQQVDHKLDDLHGKLQHLEGIWVGSANDGFQHTKQEWLKAAKDLQQTLAQIGAAVGVAHENYLQTEAANSKRWH